MKTADFVVDIQTLRARARQKIDQGAMTPGYRAKPGFVIELLNEALATQLVNMLRYKRHYFTASGMNSESIKEDFSRHALDEQSHADVIAHRIVQLGGEPNFSPDGLLGRSHCEYVEGISLVDMIREDLIAARIGIDSYRDMIMYVGNEDPTTRRLFEDVLAKEESHAEELASLLKEFNYESESAHARRLG